MPCPLGVAPHQPQSPDKIKTLPEHTKTWEHFHFMGIYRGNTQNLSAFEASAAEAWFFRVFLTTLKPWPTKPIYASEGVQLRAGTACRAPTTQLGVQLLRQFQNHERSGDGVRPRSWIVRGWSRSGLEIRGLRENVMCLWVQRHCAGAELRCDVADHAVFVR